MSETGEKLQPLDHSAQNRCFGCGEANPVGLHLEFFRSEDGTIVSFPRVPDTYEGPKGYVHGGIIATLLDEAMSKSVRAAGFLAMTRNMEVDYQRPVPSTAQLRLEGKLVSDDGRKHWAEARILNEDGKILAQAKALFIEVLARPAK